MKTEEANKIIAEYMGKLKHTDDMTMIIKGKQAQWTYCLDGVGVCYYSSPAYSKSLDSLVPVWEKMKCTQIKLGDSYGFEQCVVRYKFDEWVWSEGKSIQHAACIATAKAIKGIDGE